jgi:hypothetical protein
MKFQDFYKKFKIEAYDTALEKQKNEVIEERIVSAWMIYQTIETNKKLVRVTWILAIATIILSGLTLYFQYFNK